VTATVRCLQRAGRFDLALAALTGLTGYPGLADRPDQGDTAGPRWAVELRAEILVDRHLWQLDPTGPAWAAIGAVEAGGNSALAGLLSGQLLYWRMLNTPGRPGDQAETAASALDRAAADPALTGWATFWLGVLADNISRDASTAAERYAWAATVADTSGDRLLASYTDRHQGFHRVADGDGDAGVLLLRRSLYSRATLGAVPHVAAAQAALAVELPHGEERQALRTSARQAARELDLGWLLAHLGGE